MATMTRSQRRQLAQHAQDVRARCLRDDMAVDEIVDAISAAIPELFALEVWRLATGWNRTELSRRVDALYEADGLAAPHLTGVEICRWEHGQRRPSDERIEYLCRIYSTRPDRLGFGIDYGAADITSLARAGISNLWPRTDSDVLNDLLDRVKQAKREISVFGLTRNFYAKDEILPHFEARAVEIPVTFYVMDPTCESRRDRYRLEPVEAAMEDPSRYTREILRPLLSAARRIASTAAPSAGLKVFTYNFPCSFAIEKIDASCRVMLYGHGKRGTEGPIFVFNEGTPYWDYFASQIDWLRRLATDPREPWTSKGLEVKPLTEAALGQQQIDRSRTR
jgi:hypothetical protein